MKLRLSDLWRWDGAIGRGPYLIWGLLLFSIKFNLDRLIVVNATGNHWNPFFYWRTGEGLGPLREIFGNPAGMWILILSAPFIWFGVILTLRRLRGSAMAPALVALFFVPVINVLFFAVLCVVPGWEARAEADASPTWLGRVIPRNPAGAAMMAVFMTVVPAALFAWAGANWLEHYGWGLFVGIPFFLGLSTSILLGYHQPASLGRCLGMGFVSLALVGLLLFVVAVEGLICIAMALPIAWLPTLLGGAIGYIIQNSRPSIHASGGKVVGALLIVLPALMGAEWAEGETPRVEPWRTSMGIDAPPERVWRHVVSFSEIGPPDEIIFRAGVAHPVRAEIQGSGPGAERRCVFSTGAFVEPIEVWDEPRLLKFSVTAQPAAMEEWSPWPGLRPPHVEGYFVSRGGQFLLEPLPRGRTRLEGTTWYSHRMWPAPYWKLWSDWIVHKIHLRVLRHVKALAER